MAIAASGSPPHPSSMNRDTVARSLAADPVSGGAVVSVPGTVVGACSTGVAFSVELAGSGSPRTGGVVDRPARNATPPTMITTSAAAAAAISQPRPARTWTDGFTLAVSAARPLRPAMSTASASSQLSPYVCPRSVRASTGLARRITSTT